jgi:hypothetical protein
MIVSLPRKFFEEINHALTPRNVRRDLVAGNGLPEIHCVTDNGYGGNRVTVVACGLVEAIELQIVENVNLRYPNPGTVKYHVIKTMEFFPTKYNTGT